VYEWNPELMAASLLTTGEHIAGGAADVDEDNQLLLLP